jgi:hypothetical protein
MSTKAITVQGGFTAKDLTEQGDLRMKRKTNRRRKIQEGGDEELYMPSTAGAVNLTKLDTTVGLSHPPPILSAQPQITKLSTQLSRDAIKQNTVSNTHTPLNAKSENVVGGAHRAPLKVELRNRHTSKKVHLKPKKLSDETPHTSSDSANHRKTQKARKITLGISSLRKRVTQAKKIRDRVKEVPIDKLREQLIEKGLLKKGNKTPDAIVRQIAADAQIIIGKSL